jgi:hypothetical protein
MIDDNTTKVISNKIYQIETTCLLGFNARARLYDAILNMHDNTRKKLNLLVPFSLVPLNLCGHCGHKPLPYSIIHFFLSRTTYRYKKVFF